MSEFARSHRDLEVYRHAFKVSMRIFRLSKSFPKEEKYSLTDQIRRSSRSFCANLAEAWRNRRHEAAFVSKINDSEAETAETQCWLEFAVACEYMTKEEAKELFDEYEEILNMLVAMIAHADRWVLPSGRKLST